MYIVENGINNAITTTNIDNSTDSKKKKPKLKGNNCA
jgi:hypothetical protein